MISNVTSEAKRLLIQRINEFSKKPISSDEKGFKIHIAKAKKDGYIEGLEDAIRVIQFLENKG